MGTLKQHVKEWDISEMTGHLVSQGMGFMVDKISEKELKESRKIIEEEIALILNNNTSKVTRVEVISGQGRKYVNNNVKKGSVEISMQDEERTMKVFITTD